MNAVCCRLCGYNSSELVAIFGDQGLAAEYARKIGRYLYLLVTPADDLPKALCWMCTEQLDSFHRFHQKINEIQQRTLKDRYLEFVIEAHHRFVEEGEIEIVEHNAVDEEEDDVPPSKSCAPLEEAIEEVQVIESHVEEEEEGGEADELTVRLIPDGTEENSFLVVKTESEAVVVEETQVQENRQIPSVDTSQVEVFEIRKSSRKRRSKTEGANDDEEDIMLQQKTPRRRSRQLQTTPKNRLAASTSNAKQDSPSQKVSGKQHGGILADHDEYYEETNEGESGDEFPARDSDNEEWPAAETMDKFPTTLIRDGLLVVKGTLLMDMINRYDTPGGLSAHKRNVHLTPLSAKVPHVCEVCANSFATSSGLKEHMRTIHQPQEKVLVQCPECSKWLMNSRCLKIHMQLHRKDDYECDLCDYKTKKAPLLKRHHITHHQQERPFACDECDKTFKHKRALTIHKGTKHTGDSNGFKCNFCDRTFKSSTNFYTHRKNRHPVELAAMKEQAEAEKKLQRIRAGIEPDDVPLAEESTITTTPDGTRIITINSRNYSMNEPMNTMIVLDISGEPIQTASETEQAD